VAGFVRWARGTRHWRQTSQVNMREFSVATFVHLGLSSLFSTKLVFFNYVETETSAAGQCAPLIMHALNNAPWDVMYWTKCLGTAIASGASGVYISARQKPSKLSGSGGKNEMPNQKSREAIF